MNNPLDLIFFVVLPYLAIVLFLVETIRRYLDQQFTYTSHSSQFLENRFHFWTMIPFHYGLLVTLIGHVIAFLFPRELVLWNSMPVRLVILEVTALIFGMMALVGVIHIIVRRYKYGPLRVVTTRMDWIMYLLLFFIIGTGVFMAIFHRWGTYWFASAVSPYLWSLIRLQPDTSFVSQMPLLFKMHVICAFSLIAVFPFTRLVHVLVIPNQYFLRKRQLVRWYWDRKKIRSQG